MRRNVKKVGAQGLAHQRRVRGVVHNKKGKVKEVGEADSQRQIDEIKAAVPESILEIIPFQILPPAKVIALRSTYRPRGRQSRMMSDSIGGGAAREVYPLGDSSENVIKILKPNVSKKFSTQNKNEVEAFLECERARFWMPQIESYDTKEFLWVVAERCDASKARLRRVRTEADNAIKELLRSILLRVLNAPTWWVEDVKFFANSLTGVSAKTAISTSKNCASEAKRREHMSKLSDAFRKDRQAAGQIYSPGTHIKSTLKEIIDDLTPLLFSARPAEVIMIHRTPHLSLRNRKASPMKRKPRTQRGWSEKLKRPEVASPPPEDLEGLAAWGFLEDLSKIFHPLFIDLGLDSVKHSITFQDLHEGNFGFSSKFGDFYGLRVIDVGVLHKSKDLKR